MAAWQLSDGGSSELTVQQFVNTQFGIKTVLTGPGTKYINYGNGLEAAVGDEVLSRYWKTASPGSVGSASDHRDPRPERPRAIRLVHAGQPRRQACLPAAGGHGLADGPAPAAATDQARRRRSHPGSAVFGFSINGSENTDSTLTDANGFSNDQRHGCDVVNTQCGHHTRMYPVKNAAGAVVPNLWLLLVDSEGTNLDFQDVVYLISNITPA